jgi:hypothetical protein
LIPFICSYDITPTRTKPVKKKTNNTAENYNINDLQSDDSTDDEDAPRKRIPEWATGKTQEIVPHPADMLQTVLGMTCKQ